MIALLGCALALGAEGTIGLAYELDLVGPLGVGPRFEAARRLSGGDGGQRVIGALAVVPTSEFVFVPWSVGWRSTGKVTRRAAPIVGAGLQLQAFVISDAPVELRHAWYAELGARWSPRDDLSVAAVLAPELITFGVPGIGLAARLGLTLGR